MHLNHPLFLLLKHEARSRTGADDPSHDFSHIERVTNMAHTIAVAEGADTDIVLPASLFHDLVNYAKNDPRSAQASQESADQAREILLAYALSYSPGYPSEKIGAVATCIAECSFSKGIVPKTIEGKVVQDADLLEATGMIAIMRTFSSCGQMKRRFYDPKDPFCVHRGAQVQHSSLDSGLDLFYRRLLVVPDRLHTETAKKLATRRHQFLLHALDELRLELEESQVL